MKRLFCTVVTDINGVLESPIVWHVNAETMQKAEDLAREMLVEYNYDDANIDEIFDIFTFEVTSSEIIEA
jgi:hypothetical protein